MASLNRLAIALILIAVGNQALAQEARPSFPLNLFEQSPYSWKYHNWWRPYRTIFDPEKVLQIQRRLDAVPVVEARSVDLEGSLKELASSSFLYPVLAANGVKGRVILERYLSKYGNGAPLDDRWLLIIAALGRNPSLATRKVLEKEFDRILEEYSFPPIDPSNPVSTADARLPVADAILACLAGEQALTGEAIEQLVRRIHGTPQNELLWMIGLEWAQALMPEEKVLDILEDGFRGCTDADLRAAMNLDIMQSPRVSVLVSAASTPRSVWPLTRSLLLRESERRKVVSDYIVVLYSLVLVNQADNTDGTYTVDQEIVEAFLGIEVIPCRFLARNCWLLARCRPSMSSQRWNAFLREHADELDEKDRTAAESMLVRILGPDSPQFDTVHEGSRPFANITKPGVHMMGFRGAGGLRPGAASPKSQPD